MIKYIRFIFILTIVMVIAIPFAGSYSVQSMDDLAYLVVLGIDLGESNNYNVTFEFTKPNSSGENAAPENAPTIINSVEATSIDSAINLMNTYVSKEISLAHCKAIIISEKLAASGISKILYSLMNKTEIRPDTNLIVSKCKAKEYIQNVQPSLENLVAKYYEIAPVSSEYTGYTENVQLGDFFNKFSSYTSQSVAMLGGINNTTPNKSKNYSSIIQNEASGNAGDSPLENQGQSETLGLAVFKDDKLVGELTAIETLCHLLITDNIESCNIFIPDPDDPSRSIDLYIYNKSKPDIQVDFINGSPLIKLDLKLEAKILSISNTSDDASESRLKSISNSANSYIKSLMNTFLYKITKDYNSDINGFGEKALSKFTTTDEFQKYNWLDNYKDSFFDVNVDTNIQSSFLLNGQ